MKEFSIMRDGLKLYAVLERPVQCGQDEKGPLVILMHGFAGDTGCVPGHIYQKLTEQLLSVGQSVLRFDFNGHGKSEGSFSNMNIFNEINDVIAVLEYVRKWSFVTEITLIGHSQGGVVGGMAAGYYQDLVSRLVLLAPAASLKTDAQKGTCFGTVYDTDHIPAVVSVDQNRHQIGGHYFRIAKALPIYEVTGQFKKPVLLICGGRDTIIGREVADEYQTVLADCIQITYPQLDHGLEGEEQDEMFREIVRFIGMK